MRRMGWVVAGVMLAALVTTALVIYYASAAEEKKAGGLEREQVVEGGFALNRDIAALVTLWHEAKPPVERKRFEVVKARTVRFENTVGQYLDAKVDCDVLNWPREGYTFRLEALDGDGHVLAGQSRYYQSRGENPDKPEWKVKTQLAFGLNVWPAVKEVKRFRLSVGPAAISWGKE